jgi:acyl-homoserine lactone acylase PvdQ
MQDDDGDGLTTAHEKLVTKTNPNNGDTDADGLGDRDELLQSRNPLVGDSTSPKQPEWEQTVCAVPANFVGVGRQAGDQIQKPTIGWNPSCVRERILGF